MGIGGTEPRRTHSTPPTPYAGPEALGPMKLGTRGSPLALVQARAVAARLGTLGVDVEIVPIRTEGDRRVDARLAAIGGKGLFVRKIEEALREGLSDGADHSLKYLAAELPPAPTTADFAACETP